MLDALEADYGLRGIATGPNLSLIRIVRRVFGAKWADRLTDDDVNAYIKKRKANGAANSTVNNALQKLGSAYRLAKLTPPSWSKLSTKDNVRHGFYSPAEFRNLLSRLPEDLRDFVLFGYLTGWRKGSIAKLRWADVDSEDSEINLPGQFTKNGEPLKMAIEGEIAAVIKRREKARAHEGAVGPVIGIFVFHREGRPVSEFRKSWDTACIASGLGIMICPKCKARGAEKRCAKCKIACKYQGRIFHDLRRTSARDLIRSGVGESVAMCITGHKTNSMFKRYNITDSADVRKAMQSVARYREHQQQKVVQMEASR